MGFLILTLYFLGCTVIPGKSAMDVDLLHRTFWKNTVSESCLECIADKLDRHSCATDTCSVLGITQEYWNDGGKPTVNNENPKSPNAFKNCAKNSYCSAVTAENYMSQYKRDCNGDNEINCHDFLKIHILGPVNCKNLTEHIGKDDCMNV